MIIALARPQATTLVPSAEGTIILAIDVSGSMTATDLNPNRLEAAKAAAHAFVDKQPDTVQVGIVSFSDNAFVIQPPTDDKAALDSAINRLNWQARHRHWTRAGCFARRHCRKDRFGWTD